ncbi:glycoside hydrolase family 19 protein [Janthinobacterium aquaticum]|uniref:glycoside hydrolase family 19 protein n=1 Tax=Janthinobacterium sp. FT58W TaxID=2654254 RepID=UPI0012647A1F|nr:glycoside hydrolase family 19 protein [Janthinobacterium sp. FT58W]KAB8042542.1 glycoside hydrolase family 19 protein [Janthinobacterium sp. FT58W]
MITLQQLNSIMPNARSKAGIFLPALNAAMAEFGITTPARQAAFLSQIGHESGQLLYVRELWAPTAAQLRYERDFSATWPPRVRTDRNQLAYDLGNSVAGDGSRYRGRGLIQITGRTNYAACGKALSLDLLAQPALLEQTINACRSAGWFWQSRGLNALADAGDQVAVTRRINGGTNGLADRQALFAVAQRVLA